MKSKGILKKALSHRSTRKMEVHLHHDGSAHTVDLSQPGAEVLTQHPDLPTALGHVQQSMAPPQQTQDGQQGGY